ncbi:hypothetical protein B0T13DRAFT_442481 [Neurospora crassa]|nr:hypothetical protein B0T13DRAFT_442481 [Neurospora crassa]
MSSRFSAARPKRASEAYARAHHGESRSNDDDTSSGPSHKKVKFDVRNPSALAPSAHDDDLDEADEEVLAADVIGGLSRATKRGAVNIDGYDSDSDNDNLEDRAEARGKSRKKGKDAEDVDLAEMMDNYNKPSNGAGKDADEDDEVDMFGDLEDDDGAQPTTAGGGSAKDKRSVHFLADSEIEGQDLSSKAGGTININPAAPAESVDEDDDDDDDEEAIAAAIAEEGVDEEVGLGGLKKHAPKIDAFNMQAENEEGAFDEAGNYIRKAADQNAVHDKWLEGLSKKEIKKAALAHEKREAERRAQEREDDKIATGDLLRNLILALEKGETALEALARLGKDKTKGPKKVPKWKQKRQERKQGIDSMDVDDKKEEVEDPKQKKIREAIDAITEAADKLLGRDYPDIYDKEREWLVREYRAETGETWVEPTVPEKEEKEEEQPSSLNGQPKMWEFRWTDGRDGGGSQGPYDGPTMKAWQDAGYFKEAVEFRPVGGGEGEWSRVAAFV